MLRNRSRDQPWWRAAETEICDSFGGRLPATCSHHTELVIAIAELPSCNRGDSLDAALANVVTPAALHRELLTARQIAADGETARAHLHVRGPNLSAAARKLHKLGRRRRLRPADPDLTVVCLPGRNSGVPPVSLDDLLARQLRSAHCHWKRRANGQRQARRTAVPVSKAVFAAVS